LAEQGDIGQWINMPYFNGAGGMRYALEEDGNAMSPDQFVEYARSRMVDAGWFNKLLIISNEFEDGPPCLQALAQVGYPSGTRNDGLYNIGVYLKKSRPDTWKSDLEAYNHRYMTPPLEITEVQGVVKSLNKKEYMYACNKQPAAQHCNATLCRTRRFGVGNGANGKFPTLGGLTKLDTKPPIWFWSIDGVRMELATNELQDPRTFQRKCMEYLNIMPSMPTALAWQAAVSHAMESINVIEVPNDASMEGQFWEMAEKFLNGRSQAMTMDEILLGKPHTKDGRTYFRLSDLMSFLTRHKFFAYTPPKITSMLKDYNGEHHFQVIKGRGTNFWSIPELSKQVDGFKVPDEVNEGGPSF
jgi:hypothetical protein